MLIDHSTDRSVCQIFDICPSGLPTVQRLKKMTELKPVPQRLKEAAIEMIVSRGYGNATLVPILERGGLSKGALFHHFKSREELTAAAYADLLDTIMAEMRTHADDLMESKIDLDTFLTKTARLFMSDNMIATMEIALAIRVSPNLADLVGTALEKWEEFLSGYWIEIFDLPNTSVAVQTAHWLMVMDVLRGIGVQYAFNLNDKHIGLVIDRLKFTCFLTAKIRGPRG
ncbi:TetR/AcrR family transcriptional regulator (plasmid) [Rhizobium sp. NIBRBAC000502774]|nr:TetR/AcrR family transcriptional regulator [Rhizobium sp. NIBRBAC000502774]